MKVLGTVPSTEYTFNKWYCLSASALTPGLGNQPAAKSVLPPVCRNGFIRTQPCSCISVLFIAAFCTKMGELRRCNRDHLEHKAHHVYRRALHRRSLPTSDLPHFFNNKNLLSTYCIPGSGLGPGDNGKSLLLKDSASDK